VRVNVVQSALIFRYGDMHDQDGVVLEQYMMMRFLVHWDRRLFKSLLRFLLCRKEK
jgi:hypothetical protein